MDETFPSAIDNYGFPLGYFVIRSLATNRLFDVAENKSDDEVEVILFPEKESSLVQDLRKPEADNQVFFIDTNGALCSKSSGHAIDVQGGRLVLRHRRPMSYPFPNAYSHPLPQFSYSAALGHVAVAFSTDPSYPRADSAVAPSNAWRNQSYFLTSVPSRKLRGLLEDASIFFSSLIGSGSTDGVAAAEHVHDTDIDLRDDEILDSDRHHEADEADDSPELLRRVRVVGVRPGAYTALNDAAQMRRRWIVEGISHARMKASWIASSAH